MPGERPHAARAAEQVDRSIGRGERERGVGLARAVVELDDREAAVPLLERLEHRAALGGDASARGQAERVRCGGMASSIIENESQEHVALSLRIAHNPCQ